MNKMVAHQAILQKNKHILGIGILIFLLTLTVYGQVKDHAFLDFDDYEYITENPHVRTGLKGENIVWAFTSYHSNNWHPLTWISHMLDVQIFGLNPGGHHLVNVLFHIANALLLLIVFQRLTGALGPSAFAAALFALHPLHVESVAWAAERKDVLSCFFWLLTMLMYVRYTEKPGAGRYLPLAAVFALGLMAKQMLVTLPFVLLLLDYWPLGRAAWPSRGKQLQMDNGLQKTTPLPEAGKDTASRYNRSGATDEPWRTAKKTGGRKRLRSRQPVAAVSATTEGEDAGLTVGRLFLEKLPLMVLAAVAAVVVFTVQLKSGVLYNLPQFPLTVRIENALVSYVAYLGKTFWPVDLAVFYPHPLNTLAGWKVFGAAGLLLIISFTVVRWVRRRPYLAVGWFWYLGTLIPVIGLVQVGVQAMADRYTYIPLIGVFIMIAWGGWDVLNCISRRRGADATTAVRVKIPAGQQNSTAAGAVDGGTGSGKEAGASPPATRAFSFSVSSLGLTGLIAWVIAITSLLVLSYMTWKQTGFWRDNITLYERAIRVVPDNYWAYNNLGAARAARGELAAAETLFAQSLAIMPTYPGANRNMAVLLYKQGKYDAALPFLDKALRIQPRNPDLHFTKGAVLLKLNRNEEAANAFREALSLRPGDPDAAAGLREASTTTRK